MVRAGRPKIVRPWAKKQRFFVEPSLLTDRSDNNKHAHTTKKQATTMAGPPPEEEIMPSGATEVPGVAETQVSNDCKNEINDDSKADDDDDHDEPAPLAESNGNDNNNNTGFAELEGSGHESFDGSDPEELEEEAIDDKVKSSSSSSRERAIKVKFSGMEGPSPPPEVNLETISRSQLIAKLGGLQERLTQTQVDLKQEKSSRRKKEKKKEKNSWKQNRLPVSVEDR